MIAELETPAQWRSLDSPPAAPLFELRAKHSAGPGSLLAPCGRHAKSACCGKCHYAAGHKHRSEGSPAQSADLPLAVAHVMAGMERHP